MATLPLHATTLGFPRTAYALVTVSDIRGGNHQSPTLLDIAWESVRSTAEQCEGDAEFHDDEYLIVELEFTCREVKRVPADMIIRGEPAYSEWWLNRFKELEDDEQASLFDA